MFHRPLFISVKMQKEKFMKVTIQKGKTEMPFFQISHEDW